MKTLVANRFADWSKEDCPFRDFLIDQIFSDKNIRKGMRTLISSASHIEDHSAFIAECMKNLSQMLAGKSVINVDKSVILKEISNVGIYNDKYKYNSTIYLKDNKENPSALFWPHPKQGVSIRDDAFQYDESIDVEDWIAPAPDNEQGDGQSLFETWPYVKNVPLIDSKTPIGSAGSCFASEMAAFLSRAKFNYLYLEDSFDAKTGSRMGLDAQPGVREFCCRWGSMFNTPTFTQVAENAFGVRSMPKVVINFKTEGWDYHDPFRDNMYCPSLEAYEDERERHFENTRKAFKECKVFIITLGLNEGWEYCPGQFFLPRYPRSETLFGLIEHRTLTVQENVDYLQRFLDAIRPHNPDMQLIVSVSPIPFLATGRADKYHVVAANCLSKAVLRIAAEEIVERNEGVYYFPSYELVTTCTKEPWEEDQRHVTRQTIQRVIHLFKEMYFRK